jgi:single-stranded-DNA-specific exonuclease
MQKRWQIKDQPDAAEVALLQDALQVNETIAYLLNQRGIKTYDEAHTFFRPSLDTLHDPFLMKDMDKAVDRLIEAVSKGQRIMVYGDYDVDGTTSVATFYGFLNTFYENMEFYIPDRYGEGYGVSQKGIQHAAENKVSLIVTLDCGIKANERVQEANDFGIDMIICDHHNPGEKLPPALAVLDPKREDCDYPYKELSGCGVGFKLLHGYCLRNDISLGKLYDYLDLLAVSIASDIVPITGENRVLTHFGLKKLNQNPRPGLQALIKFNKSKKILTTSGIVFGIGPRINAAGRMAHAGAAVNLLLAKNEEEAVELANIIDIKNDSRRDLDSAITEEAHQMIAANEGDLMSKSTVLFKKDWHKGVIGIVASRCIDKYHRPTVILTESNGKVTGSARSVLGFNVYEAIANCSDLLEQYGGHMYAAGVTMDVKNVEAFRLRFEAEVARTITDDQLIPTIAIDTVIFLDEIDQKFYRIVMQMGPFGPQNMHPVFLSENVHADHAKILKGDHLKFMVKQEGTEASIDAIGFGLDQYYDMINSGMKFNLVYTIEENDFRGRKSLQLFVKDIKFID